MPHTGRALVPLAFGVLLLVPSCHEGDSGSDDRAPGNVSETEEDASEGRGGSTGESARENDLSADRDYRPSQQIVTVEDGVDIRYLHGEDGAGREVHHLHCEDPEALDEKAARNGDSQPIGWPLEWDGTGAMPDPYCHPDYLEVGEWEDLRAFSECWEGAETSTLADEGQSQEEINQLLWGQSQARANWEQTPYGGTCAQQWAEMSNGDPLDFAEQDENDD